MARRLRELRIDLDSLTEQDRADARAVAAAGGVDIDAADLSDLAGMPIPALTALIFVTLRREAPRITPGRCVRLALAAQGKADDGG